MANDTDPSQDGLTPPPGIGLHAGRELDLMLSGLKPLAYFSELTRADFEWPDAAFQPHVESGELIKRVFLHEETIAERVEEIRFLYFSLPGEAWRIDRAHRNRLRGYGIGREPDEDAREMGELLGYTDDEISTFLAWRNRVRGMVRT